MIKKLTIEDPWSAEPVYTLSNLASNVSSWVLPLHIRTIKLTIQNQKQQLITKWQLAINYKKVYQNQARVCTPCSKRAAVKILNNRFTIFITSTSMLQIWNQKDEMDKTQTMKQHRLNSQSKYFSQLTS